MSTYVYGYTNAEHPLQVEDLVGVGEQAPPLRVVRAKGLAAIVSDAPGELRAKRRDVEAHATVVDSVSAAGTMLPMRFGTVAPDDGAVEAELDSGERRYKQLLSRLDGRVELNLKGFHREDAVLRQLLLDEPRLREMQQALQAAGGGTHQQKVEFGEQMAVALEERCTDYARQIVDAMRPRAAAAKVAPTVDGCFVNASFLVDAAARDEFDAAFAGLQQELGAVAELHLHGPLPAYSFVDPGETEG